MIDSEDAITRYRDETGRMPQALREGLMQRVPQILDWADREEQAWLVRMFRERLANLGGQEPQLALVAALAGAQGRAAPDGLVITCDALAIIFADDKAKEILAHGDWLTLQDDRLGGATPDSLASLEATIAAVIARSQRGEAGVRVLLRLESKANGAQLFISATPLSLPEAQAAAMPFVVLRLLPDTQELGFDEACLIEWYRLTAAEARLAAAFAGGVSLADYARRHKLSINTVRTLFARLKVKLDAEDQGAVVRKVIVAALKR